MNNLDFLDMLAIISFCIQMDNQKNIIRMNDVQDEVNKAVEDIHKHLKKQDAILMRLESKYDNSRDIQ